MNETIWFVLVVGCLILWRLGGWVYKPFRRIGVPLLVLIIGSILQVVWWKCVPTAILLYATTTLADGIDEGPIVYFWYALQVGSTLVIGLSWWQLIAYSVFAGTLYLSNNKFTRLLFPWIICELARGAVIGQTLADLYNRGGW